jgi:hypothetical protein
MIYVVEKPQSIKDLRIQKNPTPPNLLINPSNPVNRSSVSLLHPLHPILHSLTLALHILAFE